MSKKIILALIALVVIISLLLIASEDEAIEKPAPEIKDTVQIKINTAQIAKSKELHKYFKRRHEKIGFNGSVLFAEKGEVIYKNMFGYADVKKKKKNDSNTRFQIASVSKPFTTYAIMLLKQAGELSYEDSVEHYFPEFPYKGITIRLLMIHKSGLPEYFYFADKLWKDRTIPITNSDVIDLLIEQQPQRYYLPNKKYNYIKNEVWVTGSYCGKSNWKIF